MLLCSIALLKRDSAICMRENLAFSTLEKAHKQVVEHILDLSYRLLATSIKGSHMEGDENTGS